MTSLSAQWTTPMSDDRVHEYMASLGCDRGHPGVDWTKELIESHARMRLLVQECIRDHRPGRLWRAFKAAGEAFMGALK